ncbi:MAG: 1-deoxy-D-xylulose-5-phosphate reductoisomerase, partial [candidate division Zixibacteria bacterium]|nr:1-deoxy-D-xylulose-5-phosphate reductoisomerase [candidate division Zixibacteria bacterium]
IDSEHSAIWQALGNSREEEVRRIIITASGGPFRKFSLDQLREVTVKQALNHPTWKMGPKITVDSSTLANKGLEVIEAVVLFSMPTEKLKVVIHPQSIIHSMVEFVDSSIMAQLSAPDMRLPISYALFWPKRVASNFGALNLDSLSELTFEQPDFDRFPALKLAYDVAAAAGTAPAIFNAANEVAVDAFLNKGIKFLQIAELIEDAVETIEGVSRPTLEDILNADRMARQHVEKMIGKPTCS